MLYIVALLTKTIENKYLSKIKTIKASTAYELDIKVKEQKSKWKLEEKKLREKQHLAYLEEDAHIQNNKLSMTLSLYNHILDDALNTPNSFTWDGLLDTTTFPPFIFSSPEPDRAYFLSQFNIPTESFWESIFSHLKTKRLSLIRKADAAYAAAYSSYEKDKSTALATYNSMKKSFYAEQQHKNAPFIELKQMYFDNKAKGIEFLCTQILHLSSYNIPVKKDFELQYIEDTHILIVDYHLPSPDELPQVKRITFNKTQKQVSFIPFNKKESENLYSDTIHQLTLRTFYELFKGDTKKHIRTIQFNGWVQYLDKSTGHDTFPYILSLAVDRKTFDSLNLSKVDYKSCIRGLKGLSAPSLISLTPIKPILQLNKEDPRFIEAHDILCNLDSSANLADISWEDFEHLVRELLEREYTHEGCEVKITQSGHEGGVDGVIFDPDPFRGGKFIFQAKHYKNIVDPSWVRDLYGTMIHENATRGILVTTSHFGPDSYKFAQDKSITLIDSNNLLALLQQHGYNFSIRRNC